jgi:hypothetical protein
MQYVQQKKKPPQRIIAAVVLADALVQWCAMPRVLEDKHLSRSKRTS